LTRWYAPHTWEVTSGSSKLCQRGTADAARAPTPPMRR